MRFWVGPCSHVELDRELPFGGSAVPGLLTWPAAQLILGEFVFSDEVLCVSDGGRGDVPKCFSKCVGSRRLWSLPLLFNWMAVNDGNLDICVLACFSCALSVNG